MADKKKQPAKSSKASKHSGSRKKKELSLEDLEKVSGGAAKKRSVREP